MNKCITLCCFLFAAGVHSSDEVPCEHQDTKEVRVVKSDTHNLGPGSVGTGGGTSGGDQECEPTKPAN